MGFVVEWSTNFSAPTKEDDDSRADAREPPKIIKYFSPRPLSAERVDFFNDVKEERASAHCKRKKEITFTSTSLLLAIKLFLRPKKGHNQNVNLALFLSGPFEFDV